MWQDTTTYSRSDKERIPNTFTLVLKSIRIVVHRHIHYSQDQWLVSCSCLKIDCYELKNKELEKAQDEAIEIVLKILSNMINEVKEFKK